MERGNLMRYLLWVITSLTIAFSLAAWADSPLNTLAENSVHKDKKNKKCLFPKSKKPAPNWLCEIPNDMAVGAAIKSKAGDAFMEQMAMTDARAQLAQKVHATSKVVRNPNSQIADEPLRGTVVKEKIYGPNGTLYVLIGIDDSKAPAAP
jgi:hypothetical protein